MSNYSYRCDNCGAEWPRTFAIGTAPDHVDCPATDCDGIARRVISAAALHIKGGTNAGYVKR